jgi:hypothetical protein
VDYIQTGQFARESVIFDNERYCLYRSISYWRYALRIAIFGSWRTDTVAQNIKGTYSQFTEACYELGKAIALSGHTVIAAGDGQNTADYHVVRGVLDAIKSLPEVPEPFVEIVTEGSFEEDYQRYPHVFTYNKWVSSKWKISYLYSIKSADSVLVIGGGTGSFQAGLAALIANKRIVPMGTFGGAASQLLDVVDSLASNSHYQLMDNRNIGVLRGPYSSRQHQIVVSLLGLNDFPRIMIIHGRSNDWQELRTHLQETLNLHNVIVMRQDFGAGRTLPQKYEELAWRVDGAIAVATPDDIAAAMLQPDGLPINETDRVFNARARQNIWLEIGWFWGSIGLSKIMILRKGNVEIPSDLQGVEDYEYSQHPGEKAKEIKRFIESIT